MLAEGKKTPRDNYESNHEQHQIGSQYLSHSGEPGVDYHACFLSNTDNIWPCKYLIDGLHAFIVPNRTL